jgi:hypothetical protein
VGHFSNSFKLAAGEDFYEMLTKTNVLPIRACLNENL